MLLTGVAIVVQVADSDGRVVEDPQVVSTLVPDAVVGARARVPLHHDRLVGRGARLGLADFDHGADVTFAVVLVAPLPVGTFAAGGRASESERRETGTQHRRLATQIDICMGREPRRRG